MKNDFMASHHHKSNYIKGRSIGKVENHCPKVRVKGKSLSTGEQRQENTDKIWAQVTCLYFFCVLPVTSVSGSSQGKFIGESISLEKKIKC